MINILQLIKVKQCLWACTEPRKTLDASVLGLIRIERVKEWGMFVFWWQNNISSKKKIHSVRTRNSFIRIVGVFLAKNCVLRYWRHFPAQLLYTKDFDRIFYCSNFEFENIPLGLSPLEIQACPVMPY